MKFHFSPYLLIGVISLSFLIFIIVGVVLFLGGNNQKRVWTAEELVSYTFEKFNETTKVAYLRSDPNQKIKNSSKIKMLQEALYDLYDASTYVFVFQKMHPKYNTDINLFISELFHLLEKNNSLINDTLTHSSIFLALSIDDRQISLLKQPTKLLTKVILRSGIKGIKHNFVDGNYQKGVEDILEFIKKKYDDQVGYSKLIIVRFIFYGLSLLLLFCFKLVGSDIKKFVNRRKINRMKNYFKNLIIKEENIENDVCSICLEELQTVSKVECHPESINSPSNEESKSNQGENNQSEEHNNIPLSEVSQEKSTTDNDAMSTIMLKCSHKFHYGCLLQWCEVKTECPLCKKSIEEEEGWQSKKSTFFDCMFNILIFFGEGTQNARHWIEPEINLFITLLIYSHSYLWYFWDYFFGSGDAEVFGSW